MGRREIPYSPMGSRKEVSFERMQEILAKHRAKTEVQNDVEVKKGESSSKVVENNSPSLRRMKWRKRNDNVIESDGGYVVLRCTENDRPTGRFLAFRVQLDDKRLVLGGYDTGDDARQACEAHRAKEQEIAA